jgi:hypothetical protein
VRSPLTDGAAAEAQFADGANYLPTELPTEPIICRQICQCSRIADAAEFSMKCRRIRICRWSRRWSRIADAAELPMDTDPNLQTELPAELNCR